MLTEIGGNCLLKGHLSLRARWLPTQPGLIDDLDKGHYFDNPSA
jgi:hypothetical protein